VLVFINTAGLLLLMGLEFLGLILVVIYIGAITILFLFVVMMLDILQLRAIDPIGNIIPILISLFGLIISQVWFFFSNNKTNLEFISIFEPTTKLNDLQCISIHLYTELAFPLLVISILLLVAMIGAIVLTLDAQELTRKQVLAVQHQREKTWV
jgi:NADH:ubiquinone oxidoreductase subunit 6 (subunit J)